MTPPVALTIAGSDSGAGAGLQADLKAMAANRVFGVSVVTAVTAQNTAAVTAVHQVPADVVEAQLAAVFDDFDVRAVKTGMLGSAEVLATVARWAADGRLPNLVVDPVLVASSGARLAGLPVEAAYRSALFPHATVVTPNLIEAGVLLGRAITSLSDAEAAAVDLHADGPAFVIVKGGHAPGADAVDVLYDGDRIEHLRAPWVDTANTHGTGCSFGAALAAHLARGSSVREAAVAAKTYVHRALVGGAHWRLGRGHGPLDHLGFDAAQ